MISSTKSNSFETPASTSSSNKVHKRQFSLSKTNGKRRAFFCRAEKSVRANGALGKQYTSKSVQDKKRGLREKFKKAFKLKSEKRGVSLETFGGEVPLKECSSIIFEGGLQERDESDAESKQATTEVKEENTTNESSQITSSCLSPLSGISNNYQEMSPSLFRIPMHMRNILLARSILKFLLYKLRKKGHYAMAHMFATHESQENADECFPSKTMATSHRSAYKEMIKQKTRFLIRFFVKLRELSKRSCMRFKTVARENTKETLTRRSSFAKVSGTETSTHLSSVNVSTSAPYLEIGYMSDLNEDFYGVEPSSNSKVSIAPKSQESLCGRDILDSNLNKSFVDVLKTSDGSPEVHGISELGTSEKDLDSIIHSHSEILLGSDFLTTHTPETKANMSYFADETMAESCLHANPSILSTDNKNADSASSVEPATILVPETKAVKDIEEQFSKSTPEDAQHESAETNFTIAAFLDFAISESTSDQDMREIIPESTQTGTPTGFEESKARQSVDEKITKSYVNFELLRKDVTTQSGAQHRPDCATPLDTESSETRSVSSLISNLKNKSVYETDGFNLSLVNESKSGTNSILSFRDEEKAFCYSLDFKTFEPIVESEEEADGSMCLVRESLSASPAAGLQTCPSSINRRNSFSLREPALEPIKELHEASTSISNTEEGILETFSYENILSDASGGISASKPSYHTRTNEEFSSQGDTPNKIIDDFDVSTQYTYNPCTRTRKQWIDYSDSDSTDSIFEAFFASKKQACPLKSSLNQSVVPPFQNSAFSKAQEGIAKIDSEDLVTDRKSTEPQRSPLESSQKALEDWVKISIEKTIDSNSRTLVQSNANLEKKSTEPLDEFLLDDDEMFMVLIDNENASNQDTLNLNYSNHISDYDCSTKGKEKTSHSTWCELRSNLEIFIQNGVNPSENSDDAFVDGDDIATESIIEESPPNENHKEEVLSSVSDIISELENILHAWRKKVLNFSQPQNPHPLQSEYSYSQILALPESFQSSSCEAGPDQEYLATRDSINLHAKEPSDDGFDLTSLEGYDSIIDFAQYWSVLQEECLEGPESKTQDSMLRMLHKFKSIMIHMMREVISPCDNAIRAFMKKVLHIRTSESMLICNVSKTLGLFTGLIESSEEKIPFEGSPCDSHLHRLGVILAEMRREYENLQVNSEDLKNTYISELTAVAASIQIIQNTTGEILHAYASFRDWNEIQGSDLEFFNQKVLSESFKRKAKWYNEVDTEKFKSEISEDVGALLVSTKQVQEVVKELDEIFRKLTALSPVALHDLGSGSDENDSLSHQIDCTFEADERASHTKIDSLRHTKKSKKKNGKTKKGKRFRKSR